MVLTQYGGILQSTSVKSRKLYFASWIPKSNALFLYLRLLFPLIEDKYLNRESFFWISRIICFVLSVDSSSINKNSNNPWYSCDERSLIRFFRDASPFLIATIMLMLIFSVDFFSIEVN